MKPYFSKAIAKIVLLRIKNKVKNDFFLKIFFFLFSGKISFKICPQFNCLYNRKLRSNLIFSYLEYKNYIYLIKRGICRTMDFSPQQFQSFLLSRCVLKPTIEQTFHNSLGFIGEFCQRLKIIILP